MSVDTGGPKQIAAEAEKVEVTDITTARDFSNSTSYNKAERALILRIQAASWAQIVKILDYDDTYAARAAVEAYISQTEPSEEEIGRQRYLHNRRLERLLNSVMPTAVNTSSPDHLAYNARALAILDRVAQLQGLNAPQQQVVYTPRAAEIEKYVAHFAALAQEDTASAEADVLDADVEEEED